MADKKKSTSEKKKEGKRSPIGVWQVVGLAIIALAACWHFGTKTTEYEGFVQPRQVNVRFIDADESPVSGVVVERQVNASTYGPSQVWHSWAGPTDSTGTCTFAIGGRDAGASQTTYLWGLYNKEQRDHPVVEYRFARAGKVFATLREENLLALPESGRVDPNHTTFLEPLPDEMLEETDGKVVVCNMTIKIDSAADKPLAPEALDPNKP